MTKCLARCCPACNLNLVIKTPMYKYIYDHGLGACVIWPRPAPVRNPQIGVWGGGVLAPPATQRR